MNQLAPDLIEKLLSENDASIAPKYQKTLMFAFSARSGSTVITASLTKMGLAREIREIFNPRGPAHYLLKRVGGENINDYLNNIHDTYMHSDAIIFKTVYSDFAPVIQSGLADSLLPRLSAVYIERKDKVLQAVSAYKAMLSDQWHKKSTENFSSDLKADHPIDLEKISRLVENLEDESRNWRKFFCERKIEPLQIWYEDFDSQPEAVLQKIFSEIVDTKCTTPVKLSHKKLRDEVSLQWADRVRRYMTNKDS